MPQFDSKCILCSHYLLARACLAFPQSIPDEIWEARNDHALPYPGDHGIQFEPLETEGEVE